MTAIEKAVVAPSATEFNRYDVTAANKKQRLQCYRMGRA